MEPCKQEKIIDVLLDDIHEIRKDIKTLLKFKWQIMGGAGILGIAIAFIVNFLVK